MDELSSVTQASQMRATVTLLCSLFMKDEQEPCTRKFNLYHPFYICM